MLRIFSYIAFVSASLVAGIAAALLLIRLKPDLSTAHHSAIASSYTTLPDQSRHTGGSVSELSTNGSPADILQLPKANTDFVGYWGGYIHSSIRRLNPDLIGASPHRISVVFGRRDGTVFMASELYSSPKQKIVHRPKARVVGARLAIVEYESEDNDLYYVYSDRFRLNDASRISYQRTVDVYSRNRRSLMGVVTEHATLKPLRTPREQLGFARPGSNQIPRVKISASANSAAR